MNADNFKYKEITDIILRSFYEVYNEKVTVELKAVCTLNPAHEAQLINYLKATNIDGLVKSPSGLSFRVKREILVSTTGEILLQY